MPAQTQVIDIETRIEAVQQRIAVACERAHRPVDEVKLLAVSKTKPQAAIEAAIQAGQQHFGENYLQEAVAKIETIGPQSDWHFIGAIQSNKTKPIAEHFDWVHTVSSEKICRRLNDQRPEHLTPLKIFLQINIDQDPAKSGLDPDELPEVVATLSAYPRLALMGLMTLPRQRTDENGQREPFRKLRELQQKLMPEQTELSMGMSGDLEAAILEGATWVRVGTDIFGAREKK